MGKPAKPFLKAPEGVRVKRHQLKGGEVRFTVPTMLGHEKLVAISRQDKFVWICKGFSA